MNNRSELENVAVSRDIFMPNEKIKSTERENRSLLERRKRTVLKMTKWFGIIRHSGMMLTICFGLLCISLVLFLADQYNFPVRSGTGGLYDPALERSGTPMFVAIILLLVTLFGTLWFVIPAIAGKAFAREVRHIERLPFQVVNYFEKIGGSFASVVIEIHWKNAPDQKLLMRLTRCVDLGHDVYFQQSTRPDINSLNIRFNRFSNQNGYLVKDLFGRLNSILLLPAHHEFGIEKVIFS